MKIEIWSDYVCPFCYIGKRKLEQAMNQLAHKDKIEIYYKSYELDPHAEETSDQSIHHLLAKKYDMSVEQMKQMNEKVMRKAAEVGLVYDFDIMKYTNTFDAHRLVKAAAKQGKEKEMVDRLFKAFFTEGKLISHHQTLIELATEVGMDPEKVETVLDSCKFTRHVRDDEEQATEIGVQGVPFFVFNEKYALSGAQPFEVFVEVLEKVWEEECADPELQSLTSTNRETSYCTGEDCQKERS